MGSSSRNEQFLESNGAPSGRSELDVVKRQLLQLLPVDESRWDSEAENRERGCSRQVEVVAEVGRTYPGSATKNRCEA